MKDSGFILQAKNACRAPKSKPLKLVPAAQSAACSKCDAFSQSIACRTHVASETVVENSVVDQRSGFIIHEQDPGVDPNARVFVALEESEVMPPMLLANFTRHLTTFVCQVDVRPLPLNNPVSVVRPHCLRYLSL